MDKYIKAQDLIDRIYPVDPDNDGSDDCTIVYQNLKLSSPEIEAIVEEIPAADVAPVVHSYWGEYESFPLAPSMNGYPCMNCGMHFRASSVPVLNYCPNCGAKMDGEEIN